MRGKADFYLSSRIATRPGFPGRVLCCLVNYTIKRNREKKKTHIAKICYNEVGTQQKTFGSPLAPTPTKNLKRLSRRYVFISAPLFYAFFLFPSMHRSSLPSRRGRRPDDPHVPLPPTSRQHTQPPLPSPSPVGEGGPRSGG